MYGISLGGPRRLIGMHGPFGEGRVKSELNPTFAASFSHRGNAEACSAP